MAIARAPTGEEDMGAARRWLIGLGVVLNLLTLGWFKYYGFFATSVVNALDDLGLPGSLPLVQITLPVAISFFTFHAISYLVDVGKGKVRAMGPVDFALYLSFFPHLVAGPIVRATEFEPQIARPMKTRLIEAEPAFRLILLGLFKKVVIATYLASHIADPVFGLPSEHSSLEILFGIYGYAIQIYADFSGYTDIAIGCALLLGIRFPQNFDAPYRATSLQDFWRRWHITLSRWLRDYLYIPLGGNRKGNFATARNVVLTMLLGGLWHGAAWTFVLWGGLHGAGMVIERGFRAAFRRVTSGPAPRVQTVLAWFVTFHVVCLAWVFFRAESVDVAFELLTRLVTEPGPAPLVTPLLVLVIGGSLLAQFVPERVPERLQFEFARWIPVAQAACLAAGLVIIDELGPRGVAPFIYFQF
ncbi:MAG: MBOAT family O-acyltransferase [Hyphomicrobiales bacterium]